MQCPHCAVALMMMDRQGVEIDYCPKCRGVWLDRGELDKLIERETAQVTPPPAPQPPGAPYAPDRGRYMDERRRYDRYDDDDDDYDRRYPRRKRGWLGEIFDFD